MVIVNTPKDIESGSVLDSNDFCEQQASCTCVNPGPKYPHSADLTISCNENHFRSVHCKTISIQLAIVTSPHATNVSEKRCKVAEMPIGQGLVLCFANCRYGGEAPDS